jgi:hypothetical protein
LHQAARCGVNASTIAGAWVEGVVWNAHGFPARVPDIDRVDERIAHQAADQADDAVGGQHARGRVGVACRLGALHVVHRLDQIVDAEWDRGDQDHAEKLEAGEHVIDRR